MESSNILNLTDPETIPSYPVEYIKTPGGIQQDMKSPPPYNISKNNCKNLPYKAIWQGRDTTAHKQL